MKTLHDALLLAHRSDDKPALVELYAQAADATNQRIERQFFLTHAYVFALEIGSPRAEVLRRILVDLGSEPA